MESKAWFEMNLKLVIVGDPSVGKTSLLKRIIDNEFSDKYTSTLGVDFSFKEINVRDSRIKLQIWDTAGQERYRSLITSYYKHTDGIILVFDLTDPQSFKNLLDNWLTHITNYLSGDFPKILIFGNKADLKLQKSTIMEHDTVKKQLESHNSCRLRDLELNKPMMYNDSTHNLEFNINGGIHIIYLIKI